VLQLVRTLPTPLPPCLLERLPEGKERERERDRARESWKMQKIGGVGDVADMLARAHARQRFNGTAGRCYLHVHSC